MKQRIMAILLSLCMMIGLLPATALAAEIELDISNGSIIITEEGYTQGEGEQVLWGENTDHALTITGTVDGGNQTDTATNMIEIQGGNPIITLDNINISMSSTTDQSAADRYRPPVLLKDGQTATIVLKGTNNLTGAELAPAILICDGATLTIEGDGILNATGRGNTDGIGAGRNSSRGKYGTPSGGNLVIKGGIINTKGNAKSGGIGSSYDATFASITIQGGVITTLSGSNYSLWATNVTISGGTLLSLHKTITDVDLTITGGNIGNSYTGEISGRVRTELVCFDEDGNRGSGMEVTITEGNGPAWTALTDANGVITTYLAVDTTVITAKVGDGEAKEVTIAEGKGVVGPDCTCSDGTGTLTMTTPSQSLTTVNGTATLSGLAATYAKGSCVLPDGFHGDYESISFEITKVVKNGQYMVVDHYAEINDDTLTVYGEANQDPYTVYVRAVSGPADGTKVYSDEIAISVNTYVSEAENDELDIADGSIVITETGYKVGDGQVTPWGDNTAHALTITGTVDGGSSKDTTTNMIDIQGGNPSITLKDISISMSSTMDQSAKDRYRPPVLLRENQTATIVLVGTNNLTGAEQAPGIQINSGATLTIEGDGILNATARGTCDGIGTGRDNNKGYGSDVGSGSLIIKSGIINVTGSGKCNAAIGTGYVGATGEFAKIEIQGGIITTSGGSNSLWATNVTISGGTLLDLHAAIAATTISVTGGNIGDYYTGAVDSRALTKLYFVDSTGTPKANMEVTVTEGNDPAWTALTDENGVITTYLADTTKQISAEVGEETYDNISVANHQALIGGSCTCSTFSDITWETGLPESITLHGLTVEGGEDPVSMDYDVPAAELVTDQPCNMPIHPSLPEITYELSVTKDNVGVEGELSSYATFNKNYLTLLPGNAPYTVTLTAKAGDKSVSDNITVNKGESTSEISTINLALGDAVINYAEGTGYTYIQGDMNGSLSSDTILITGSASDASVTVNGGSPTLIINQNDPNDEWTIYSGENAGNITLQPRTFNNKLRFGAVGSTMPELSYVSAAPKLKLNPDQGDITFNFGGSVTQGKFTITQLKENEEIAIWGADLDCARTITNHTGAEYTIKINGEDITLEDDGTHTISQAKYANQNETNPSTKTYIFDNGSTYALIAVGEGDASAPALANEEQEKISKALLDDDFSGTLYAGGFLFYVGLSELHAEQFSDIQVYTSTLGHVYLGAGLTDLSWGNYCATTGFTVDSENPYFTTDEKGVLYSKDYSTLYVIPSRLKGDYTTHADCTTVNANATMMIALDSLTLGKNVSSVTGGSGSYIFFANNMKAINVEAGNPYFASKDGILYDKDMTIILACPRNVQLPNSTLVVPETVTYVEEYIFSGVNIQKLVIPEGANISGGRGFYRMTALSEIQLLGSYGSTIAESDSSRMDQLAKVTVHDGFDFSGDTFKYSSMEWISSANITVTGGDAPYDGQERSVIVTTDDNELKVEYSTDGDKWSADAPAAVSAPGTYTVYWRITKPADDTYDFDRVLYSSRTFTIGGLEASEDWFTLSGPVTVDAAAGTTPVTLHQPAGAPSLDNNGYIVRYSKEGTGNPTEEKPTEAGTYLVTVEITADGYVEETLTLGNYVILSADQTNSKVISFVTNGGEPIDPIIAASGDPIEIPEKATRAGYTFAGWYSDSALRNKVDSLPTTMPSEHTTYYAKWTRDAYTIKYDLDGGTATGNPATYTTETPTFTLNNPTKPGYEFTGWTGTGLSEKTKEVTIVKGSSVERAYTANWEKIEYIIEYPKDYDKVDANPKTYTIEDTQDKAIPLTNPAREGYSFKGWTMVIDGSISYILPAEGAEIPEGTYGNLTLSGIWLAENQTMTFHANGGKFADGTDTYVISGAYDTPLLLDVTNPTRSGYSFRGWFIDQACTQLFDASTIETMPLSMDIYAGWKKKSSSDSESTGGSGTGVLDDHVIIVSNSGELTDTQIENAVKKAEKGSVITIQAVKSDEVILTVGAMEKLVENENDLLIQLRDGEVTLPEKAMAGMIEGAKSSYEVVVSLEEQTSSKEDAVAELLEKGAVVFDVTVTVNGKEIHSFDKGLTLAFTVPDLKDMEDPMVLHLLQDGEQESYGPDEISGDILTIKGIKNLSVFAVLSGNQEETETQNPFVDVFASDYYYNAVLWAVANGVTAGTSDITFSPDVTVSRAQMVTFLWRAAGSPAAEGSNPFTDVSVNDYYYNAVLWAVANGVTAGTSDTTFSPDAPVTRAQAVTFQWRAAGGPAESGESFTDIPAGAYYAPAVTWAVANGITSGTGDGCFSPDAPVSRAQAVTFLYRQYK